MFLTAWVLMILTLVTFFWVALRMKSAPIIISLMFFSMIYFLRPGMILVGANLINPALFGAVDDLAAQALMYAFLYTAAALVTVLFFETVVPGFGRSLYPTPTVQVETIVRVSAVVFSLGAVLIGLQLLARYGSVQGVIYASKISKDLAGTFAVRQVVGLGAFLASVAFLTEFQKGHLIKGLIFGGFFLTNLFVFSLWGSRLEAFVMLSGAMLFVVARGGTITGRALVTFAFYGALLLGGATFLYIYRLAELAGSWEVALSRDLATTTAVSLHMTRFDSLMLVVQDFLTTLTSREGEDFFNGLIMAIPRAVWPDKPAQLLIGQWFRQWYEPNAVNGWTVGGPGEYLVNFGIVGVLIGGIVYGLLLTIIHNGYKKMGMTAPLSVMTSFILVLIVVPEGSIIQMIPRIILWCIPIWTLVLVARVRLRPATPSHLRGSSATLPPAE